MPSKTSERVAVGDRLSCARCGTEVRMEQVGGGRIQCCAQPLAAASGGAVPAAQAAGPGARARCNGCGNEAEIERDGGGHLSCCADPMARA